MRTNYEELKENQIYQEEMNNINTAWSVSFKYIFFYINATITNVNF